jgi:uncharacterized integral membrane protein (TIGR00698 family)
MAGWDGRLPGLRIASARSRTGEVLPGLVVVVAVAVAALALGSVWPVVGATTFAVVLGAVLANSGLDRPAWRPGSRFAGSAVLRVAIVLLGLQLSLGDVADLGLGGLAVVVATVGVTFVGTQALGRRLGVSRQRSLLVATGFSICGASAIGAMRSVTRDDEDDAAVAVALVTLCGSLAIALLPALRGVLGLRDPEVFGAWVGASVHDVGQTVATASRVPGALATAVVVKLSRVVLLAPLVTTVALAARRGRGPAAPGDAAAQDGGTPTAGRRAWALRVPPFVVAFALAVGLRTTGAVPASVLELAADVQHVLLVAALVGLGTGIRRQLLGRAVGRDLLLGLTSWVLVAGVALLGVRLLHG